MSIIQGETEESFHDLRQLSYSLGSKPTLKPRVCKWERRDVAKKLHIHYQDDFTTKYTDVYEKMEIGHLNKEQKRYLEKVNSYLLPIEGRFTTENKMKYHPEMLMSVLEKISKELVTKEQEEFIRMRVAKFIKSLLSLMLKIKVQKTVYDGGYTRLFKHFTEMCCLHPEVSYSKDDQVCWSNLSGVKNVTSRPDIRLYKYGVTTDIESITGSMLVSVVKVKQDSQKIPAEIEEQSCDADSDVEKIPSIEINLNTHVLGQHAGELLLDLYHFHRVAKVPVLKMPGMIVDGTNVFLTLLEIAENHFIKLERNQELHPQDKATIYYSKPLNILEDDERSILIEIFIRLNNLQFNRNI